MRSINAFLPLLGEAASSIKELWSSLKEGAAKLAFSLSLEAMIFAGAKYKVSSGVCLKGSGLKLDQEEVEKMLAATLAAPDEERVLPDHIVVKKVNKKAALIAYPGAWKERLAELKAMLPSFESLEESFTKNPGCKGRGDQRGIPSRRRVDRRTIESISLDDDPVIGLRQKGLGPWLMVGNDQVGEPLSGPFEIKWKLIFLSGRQVIATVTGKDGKATRFQCDNPSFAPLFAELKPRMLEFIKFGPRPVKQPNGSYKDTFTLHYPTLLSEVEQEELKGLIAAEQAASILDLSKNARGGAKRGLSMVEIDESKSEHKMVSEEDHFRDRRAAKAYQKRTNRTVEEGIGEYAGGSQWEAGHQEGPDLSKQPIYTRPFPVYKQDSNFLNILELARRLMKPYRASTKFAADATLASMKVLGKLNDLTDLDDEGGRTWPTKIEKAKGWEHPARHFRISLFGSKNSAQEWVTESEPVNLDTKHWSCTSFYKKGYIFRFLEVAALKEKIYEELENGEILFWAESYEGEYGYPYSHMGLRVPSLAYTKLDRFYNLPSKGKDGEMSIPMTVPSVKVEKPKLPCRQCGHTTWRLTLHAEVCDYCESEAFPRTWINALIPMWMVRRYVGWEDKETGEIEQLPASHLKVRLYGRAVSYVVFNALRRKMNITQMHVHEVLRPGKPFSKTWRNIPSWGFEPKIEIRPVGIGQFLWS